MSFFNMFCCYLKLYNILAHNADCFSFYCQYLMSSRNDKQAGNMQLKTSVEGRYRRGRRRARDDLKHYVFNETFENI